MAKLTSLLRGSRARSGRPVRGHLDGVQDGKAWGWAFAPEDPARRVLVRLVIDGESVAEVPADNYRADLHEKGFGDGSYAFAFFLPDDKLDGREHEVDVVDVLTGSRLVALRRSYRFDPVGADRQRATNLLFDASFYAKQTGPIGAPLDHYRTIGWRRGLHPHPLFDARRYARLQELGPDVEPLAHFETTGQFTGASIHALFDQPIATGGDGRHEHPVFAYLERRSPPGLEPSVFFSDSDYAAADRNVVAAGFLPLSHYLVHGWREGRRPHSDFDPRLFGRLAALDADVEPYSHFVDWLAERTPTLPSPAPRVSIVVLTVDKALLTLQCLYFLERHTVGHEIEIIVVDNGSADDDFAFLCRYANGVEIVRVGANRGFGEGNNIGAEHARGDFVLFLNNDVFVTGDWLQPLLDVLDADPLVGAVGPKFLYPDGRLQEAGATVSSCGTAVQRGKHLDPRLSIFNRTEPVDYCSAALLMVRAEAFRAVLGFDLCWDPAYYEDSDLCLKLRTIGLNTVYAHRSEAVHLEHATSGGARIKPTLRNIVATNRLKFVERWSQEAPPVFRKDPAVVADLRPSVEQQGSSLALYSPYPLTPGGGERYLLTIAATYGRERRCTLFTPDRNSRIRLLTLARELDLDLDHVEVALIADTGRHDRFDTFVCMGNELLPPIGGIGVRNVYHCQFPFPMEAGHHGVRWRNLDGYDIVMVNSTFTADHYRRGLKRLGLASKPVLIVPPPVPDMGLPDRARRTRSPVRILNIGRFASAGHCKRQDAMIQALKLLRKQVAVPLELHLAGAVGADLAARDYLERLLELARNQPVVVHPNPSAAQIAELYADATLYWHLTGVGADIEAAPELFEHFGIAIAEGMSAGVVPVGLRGAGPSEIITDQVDGILVKDAADLVRQSAALLTNPGRIAKLAEAAARRAANFHPNLFGQRFAEAVERSEAPPHPAYRTAAQ